MFLVAAIGSGLMQCFSELTTYDPDPQDDYAGFCSWLSYNCHVERNVEVSLTLGT